MAGRPRPGVGWEAVVDRSGTVDLWLDGRPVEIELSDLDEAEAILRRRTRRRGRATTPLQVIDRDGSRSVRHVTA